MDNFLSYCKIYVREVVLEDDRKSFSVGFVPNSIVKNVKSTTAITDTIEVKDGFEEFFLMLDLNVDVHNVTTNVNLIGNAIACNLIFLEGHFFAISSLETCEYVEKCFVLEFGKNYCLKEVKDLAKKKKRQELYSLLEHYNARTKDVLKKLSELEEVSLEIKKSICDKTDM